MTKVAHCGSFYQKVITFYQKVSGYWERQFSAFTWCYRKGPGRGEWSGGPAVSLGWDPASGTHPQQGCLELSELMKINFGPLK